MQMYYKIKTDGMFRQLVFSIFRIQNINLMDVAAFSQDRHNLPSS